MVKHDVSQDGWWSGTRSCTLRMLQGETATIDGSSTACFFKSAWNCGAASTCINLWVLASQLITRWGYEILHEAMLNLGGGSDGEDHEDFVIVFLWKQTFSWGIERTYLRRCWGSNGKYAQIQDDMIFYIFDTMTSWDPSSKCSLEIRL